MKVTYKSNDGKAICESNRLKKMGCTIHKLSACNQGQGHEGVWTRMGVPISLLIGAFSDILKR